MNQYVALEIKNINLRMMKDVTFIRVISLLIKIAAASCTINATYPLVFNKRIAKKYVNKVLINRRCYKMLL